MSHSEKLYTSQQYLDQNPSWDIEDSGWKAEKVASCLSKAKLKPSSICEVGCGAGGILAALRDFYPDTSLTGFDIAPDAQQFWRQHAQHEIDFLVGDFFELNRQHYETILMLDVLEHVADPFGFLARVKPFANHFVFHFPLDLSALSVLRESPLMYVRKKVGHIHYFTKGLALALLDECGFEVLDWEYTGAAFNSPQAGIRTKLAKIPRYLAYAANKDFGVRLLGGETLMVLAKSKAL